MRMSKRIRIWFQVNNVYKELEKMSMCPGQGAVPQERRPEA